MTPEEVKQLKGDITEELVQRYFLIPRNAWWAFIGGALAFAVAVGVVSYQSALKVISDPAVQAAKQTVLDAQTASEKALSDINANLAKSGNAESRIQKLEQGAIANGAVVSLKPYRRPGHMLDGTSPTAQEVSREQWTIKK